MRIEWVFSIAGVRVYQLLARKWKYFLNFLYIVYKHFCVYYLTKRRFYAEVTNFS